MIPQIWIILILIWRKPPMLKSSWIWLVFPFFAESWFWIGFDHCQKTKFNRWRSEAIWKLSGKILLNQPRLVIFAEGKLDNASVVKLLKQGCPDHWNATPKEQDLKALFASQAQELGIQFVEHSLDQLLLKSGYDFGVYRRISLCCRLIVRSDYLQDIQGEVVKSLQDNILIWRRWFSNIGDQARNLVRISAKEKVK